MRINLIVAFPVTAVALWASVAFCAVLSPSIFTLERVLPLTRQLDFDSVRARDRLRHSRMLQAVARGVVDFPVEGSADSLLIGLYFTKVRLGSPPKEFNVQIDTGSDILWVACSSCTNCPQTSELGMELNFFDSSSSSTSYAVPCSDRMCTSQARTTAADCSPQSNLCSYSFHYGDGSGTSGYYVADTLFFDMILGESLIANSSAPIVFGCSNYQSGDLTETTKAIDGIFGFGQGDLSVISQLSSRGITPKVFSHCLKGDGNGGGIMVLGEIMEPSIVYSPLVPSQPHYNLYLQSIAVNGQLLPIDPAVFTTSNSQGTIIDSGTTFAYLVEDVFNSFVNAITDIVSPSANPVISKGRQCYLVLTSLTEIFPPVSFNFAGGASMLLKPEEYLVHDEASLWCIGFLKAPDGIMILGDIVLKDKIFVYDLAHQRIGWAPYDCSLSVNVSVTSGKDEFMNEGQLSKSRSSQAILFMLLLPMLLVLLPLHISSAFMNLQFF